MHTDLQAQILTWNDVRSQFEACNSELCAIIDQISPDNALPFIKVSYPFGAKIVDKGRIQLPSNSDRELYNKLNYKAIPLGIVLNKSSEVFVDLDHRVIPLDYLEPGDLFGLFETLQINQRPSTPLWSICAGARSIFMLAKITDANSHKRLHKAYNTHALAPKTLNDHWKIFADIANNSHSADLWTCEILFFTEEWFKPGYKDPGWLRFENYLYKQGWEQTQSLRDDSSLAIIWDTLSRIISEHRLKPSPYLVNTLKHILSIITGSRPGFAPAENNDRSAPIRIIQDAYVDTYNLKNHLPIMMHPAMLRGKHDNISLYYSLLQPTLIELTSRPYGPAGLSEDLLTLRTIFKMLSEWFQSTELPIPERLKRVRCDFFHGSNNNGRFLLPTSEMPSLDEKLLASCDRFSGRSFPISSPFARGCIRMSVS